MIRTYNIDIAMHKSIIILGAHKRTDTHILQTNVVDPLSRC